MSDNCCHCCERRELKKQCRIDTFSNGYDVDRVRIIHLPTGYVAEGTDVDKTLDMLRSSLKIFEDESIDTVTKFKKAAKKAGAVLDIFYV